MFLRDIPCSPLHMELGEQLIWTGGSLNASQVYGRETEMVMLLRTSEKYKERILKEGDEISLGHVELKSLWDIPQGYV